MNNNMHNVLDLGLDLRHDSYLIHLIVTMAGLGVVLSKNHSLSKKIVDIGYLIKQVFKSFDKIRKLTNFCLISPSKNQFSGFIFCPAKPMHLAALQKLLSGH